MTQDDSTITAITGDVHGIPVARWENRPGYLQLSKPRLVPFPQLRRPRRRVLDSKTRPNWDAKSQTMNPFPLILNTPETMVKSRGYLIIFKGPSWVVDIGDGINHVEVQVLLPVDSKNRLFSIFILNLRLILHRFQCSLEILERYLGSIRVNAPRAPEMTGKS